ncbi:uncharacterized protein LOC112638163, partial [Camponotus floridanus]|uniref:uncharacterized protein LOC112638163 n=1 Tax=Camponotus floridanus TaxID=104421 RepID=UPI000DC67ECE
MVRTLKSSIDTSQSSQLETELNKFVYAYNYTPSDAVPDHKSPAEIFFEPNLNLTSQQKQMKQQFDAHHGARPRSFVLGQSVLIQFSNGQRIPGKIVRLIGKALARVSFEGGFITRHFNQIWNRPKRQEKKSNTISEDLLSSGKESARIQPDPVLHTSLGEREEAESLNNGATQPPVAAARRSERLRIEFDQITRHWEELAPTEDSILKQGRNVG